PLAEVDGVPLRLVQAREGPKVPDDEGDAAAGLRVDLTQLAEVGEERPARLAHQRVELLEAAAEEGGVAGHRAQGRGELGGGAGRGSPEGGQLLRLDRKGRPVPPLPP